MYLLGSTLQLKLYFLPLVGMVFIYLCIYFPYRDPKSLQRGMNKKHHNNIHRENRQVNIRNKERKYIHKTI